LLFDFGWNDKNQITDRNKVHIKQIGKLDAFKIDRNTVRTKQRGKQDAFKIDMNKVNLKLTGTRSI